MTPHVLSETSPESRSITIVNTEKRSGNATNVLSVMQFNRIGKLTLRLVVLKSIDVTVVPSSLGT